MDDDVAVVAVEVADQLQRAEHRELGFVEILADDPEVHQLDVRAQPLDERLAVFSSPVGADDAGDMGAVAVGRNARLGQPQQRLDRRPVEDFGRVGLIGLFEIVRRLADPSFAASTQPLSTGFVARSSS